MPDYRIGRLKGRYVVTWTDAGKRRRYRLDALTAKEAEREAIDLIRKERAAPFGATVESLWEAYRAEKTGRRVAVAMMHEWKAMGPHFGHLRPEHVTTEACRSYIAMRRKAGKHDGTIWTELGHLRTVFRWAFDHGMITRAPRIERPGKPAPKDRWLTRPEIDRLLSAECAPHIKIAIHLMLATAGRVGAVLELTWDRVNFDAGHIDLRLDAVGPRKGRAVVAMNAGLRAVLSQAYEAATIDHVVEYAGRPVKGIKTGFNIAVANAGLKNVSPHVLRHTAGVHLAAAGVKMEKIAQIMGHSSTSVTERVYARFAPDHLRDEVAVLDFTTKAQAV
jgi:integrase